MTTIRADSVPDRAFRSRGAAVTFVAIWLLSAALPAHGGQYLGPTSNPGAPVPTGPGGRPPAPGMVVGGPLTGGNANLDVSSWRVWWELNHDRYVTRDRGSAVPDEILVSTVLPSLKQALDRNDNPDINSACLIAMGKAAADHLEFAVLDVLRARLSRGHIEVRESAVLALGISGRAEAFADLDALVRNDPRGRKLVDRDQVGDRVRTFAAYALGLLANRSDSVALKAQVLESLVTVLEDRSVTDRDVLSGVLNGIRLIDVDPSRGGAHKRVLWTATAALEAYLELRFKDSRAAVQSHALTALAALVGRGDGVDQQRAKELVGAVLQRPQQESDVYCSATIALAEILRPEDEEDVAALVRRVAYPPDPMVRRLGMIAMGRIGGEVCHRQLIDAFRGDKRDDRAWAALGLGILAFHSPQSPSTGGAQGQGTDMRAEVGELLFKGLRMESNDDVQAAIAIGLGLSGYQEAAPELRRLVTKRLGIGEFAGPLCVSLAMLDDEESIPIVRGAMSTVDRPVLFGHAALALARFGQLDASPSAVGVLQQGGDLRPGLLVRLAAAAKAIGYLRNPSDAPALSRLVEAASGADLSAAFAAAALGSVADRDPLGFGARVAHGMNYTARVQTISNGRNGILDIF